MANIISDETIEYVGILAKLELSDEEKEKAKRMLGNINSSVLTDEDRKGIIKEAFELNPYSEQLYKVMFDYYTDDVDNISALAEYFGCDINSEKEKKAYEFLMENIGTTEEEAKAAKEGLLEYYKKIGITEYENLPSYQHITSVLEKFDIEYRTVDGVVFETREDADLSKAELSDIQEFMNTIKQPTKEDTLKYEEELKQKRIEFDERFTSKLKDKYLAVMDKYLDGF